MFVATCIYSAFLLLIPCVDAQLQVRLVDGTSPWNGRLEMLYNGTWSTVCVYGFGKEEAQVVCRMLGFDKSQALAVSPFTYGYDSGHLVLHNLTCTGEETSVDQCSHTGFYKQTCQFYDAIGIICNIQHTRLRLRDVYDLGPNRGRVQIDSGVGHWETVCVSSNIAARVVCRQLGLPSHAEIIRVESSYGFTGILGKVTNFLFCLGNETSLLECQHETIFSKGCRDNIIICSDSPLIILTDDSRYPLMEETDSTLRCVSKQLPLPISYSWPENAGGFPDGSSLIITRVTREHNRRRVRCEAMSSDGEVVSSDRLQLQVYYDPVIRITRSDNQGQPLSTYSEVIKGHNVTFVCDADSNPPPASITWSGKVNSTTGELHIIAAQQTTHDGIYTCTVVTESADDDQRLPLTSSYHLAFIIKAALALSEAWFVKIHLRCGGTLGAASDFYTGRFHFHILQHKFLTFCVNRPIIIWSRKRRKSNNTTFRRSPILFLSFNLCDIFVSLESFSSRSSVLLSQANSDERMSEVFLSHFLLFTCCTWMVLVI